jgi:hypothetical protein
MSCANRSTQSGRTRTGKDTPVYGTVGAAPMIMIGSAFGQPEMDLSLLAGTRSTHKCQARAGLRQTSSMPGFQHAIGASPR